MSSLFAPSTSAPEPVQTLMARRILQTLVGLRAGINRTRADAARLLWSTPNLAPADILAEMTPEDRRAMMLADVLARVSNATVDAQVVPSAGRAAALLQAFAATTPVPEGMAVVLRDAAGAEVDLSAEVAALAAKLAAVESVAVENL